MASSRLRFFLGLISLGLGAFLCRGDRPLGESRPFGAELPYMAHDSPAWAQDLQARLNSLSIDILTYLQTHRAHELDAIKREGRVATLLLRRFRAEAESARPELVARLETAHEAQRQATLAILNAESAQLEAREALTHEQARLLELLENKLLLSAQASVWRGSDRLRWLMTAIAEVKGFSAETSGDVLAAKSAVFRQAMLKYRHETPARQTASIEEAEKRWDLCVTGASKIAEQENAKRDGLAKFAQARAELDSALADDRRTPVQALANLPYGLGAGCLLIALVLLLPFFRSPQKYAASLQRLTECVEAAAAGDLFRLPQVAAEPGLERLAHGLVRLSAVLIRSENLVYHLAALVEASGDAIVSQNLEGKILSWNKGAQRMYGYAAEEARGHSIGILSPADQGAQLRQVLERVKTGEKVSPFEVLHQAQNGRLVRALVKVSVIHDSLHQVIGVSFCAQELFVPAARSAGAPLTDTLQRS